MESEYCEKNPFKAIAKWRYFFGPIPKIFPEQVQQGFAQFNKHFNSQESQILADLKYFSSFTLSWIFSWQYRYSKTENNKQFPSLQHDEFVKWWNQFDTSKAQPDKDVSSTMYSFMKAAGFTNLNLEGITKYRIVYI
ncbi:hypothetical protein GmHk_15G044480 [Glycine max]|nr:hypothetical protein GmHk_15G044480 [Glycine max]